MFELFAKVYESLASWPALQFAAIVLGGYFGIKMIMRGEQDKKPTNQESTIKNIESTPSWFVTEQSLEILRNILHENRQQTQLLEQITNENMINPRRLRE